MMAADSSHVRLRQDLESTTQAYHTTRAALNEVIYLVIFVITLLAVLDENKELIHPPVC